MRDNEFTEFTVEFQTEAPLTWEQKNAIMGGTEDRPAILSMGVPHYEYEESRYPEKIRVSFFDGHTEIYELRTQQPHPLVRKNAEIIRKTERNIKQGYVNQPRRRRRQK